MPEVLSFSAICFLVFLPEVLWYANPTAKILINKPDKDFYIYSLRDKIQYLYARSFFPSLKMNKKTKLAHDYYLNKLILNVLNDHNYR